MRASASDYTRPNKLKDCIVWSYDGYSSYLLVVDEASRMAWIFLIASKEPPIDIVRAFLAQHGHVDGGCIRTDQGGELARSPAFRDLLLRKVNYTIEPTGADSPSQNDSAEIYNDKFAVRTRTLLYGSGLPVKFWSAALLHSVYLHNHLAHGDTKKTPFEGYYECKPDLSSLKLFGARVCVKRTGKRRGKLNRHDFTGIFLGYTATDQNIMYLDLDLEIVKTSHHAQFDEAWYLQPSRPPAAQLLYDLGLETDDIDDSPTDDASSRISVPWPPLLPKSKLPPLPPLCRIQLLPLRKTGIPRPIAAAAARTSISITMTNGSLHATASEHLMGPRLPSTTGSPPFPPAASCVHTTNPSDIVSEYLIGQRDMSTLYMSPNPYFDAFDKVIDLQKFDLTKHRTAGLCLLHSDDHLYLGSMTPSTPGAKIPRWRSRLKGAWLIKIGDNIVTTIEDAQLAFARESTTNPGHITLLFSHPEVCPDISYDGLPLMSSAPFFQHVHN